jgi:asparagine synthase (glutamine-hydrolysing)
MAVSLEARTPLLDHRLVEFSWSLQPELKIRGESSKWIMRAALARFLPPALFERHKVGFTVPLASWRLGPLREWSREHLLEASTGQDAAFDSVALQRAWRDLEDGRDDKSLALWSVITLQAWRRRWGI